MSKLTKKLNGLESPVAASVFEAMVLTIIEQQILLKAAYSIERNLQNRRFCCVKKSWFFNRIIKKFGSTLKREIHIYYAFPTTSQ